MPVENIHADGTLMFNSKGAGALSESNYSFFGQIHEDDEFSDEDLKAIKDKKGALKGQFRYLNDGQAKSKRDDQAERAGLDLDVLNRQSDSTGVEPPVDADEVAEPKASAQEVVEEVNVDEENAKTADKPPVKPARANAKKD